MEETTTPPPVLRRQRRQMGRASITQATPQQFSDALALLDAAQTMLTMVERSPAIEISCRDRVGMVRGKIQLERDLIESARAMAEMAADEGKGEEEIWRS